MVVKPIDMLTKSIFFRQKIFQKVSIPVLRKQNSAQRNEIDQWYKCEEYKSIQKTKSYFENKKKLKDENFDQEITFEFIQNIAQWRLTQPEVCHYCGLPESRLIELNDQPLHYNKRWPKRGKVLEIDRKKSSLPYSLIENLVLACYWCNNAKTDTFTYAEFKEIGKIINRAWEARLEQNFSIPQ